MANDRGVRSAYLLDELQKDTDAMKQDGGIRFIDFRAPDVHLPDDYHTLYHCQVIELPETSQKHHLIKVKINSVTYSLPFLSHT